MAVAVKITAEALRISGAKVGAFFERRGGFASPSSQGVSGVAVKLIDDSIARKGVSCYSQIGDHIGLTYVLYRFPLSPGQE